MIARFRKLLGDLGEMFGLLPAAMVVVGIVGAVGLVEVDRSGLVPAWLVDSPWLYNGGGVGARTLLGAVAASSIGVAGTVFSITIAALALAAGQMGPRLLRNFTRDRGNQVTLGAFLGTFSYALMVLRSVRTQTEGAFVPHLSLSVGILFAFLCVGTLVYFVGHMAGRINVDTVIDLVSHDVGAAAAAHTTATRPPEPLPPAWWSDAIPIVDVRHGYLQQLDEHGLADWAAERGTAIRLLRRPGEYVFPGTPIAVTKPYVVGPTARSTTPPPSAPKGGAVDLEFPIRQLVEVAMRALSPSINDPYTAMTVIERLGEALCGMAGRYLPTGVSIRKDRVVLEWASPGYHELLEGMFQLIRQNAKSNASVLGRLLEVLTEVAECEPDAARIAAVRRNADLVMVDATREVLNPSDLYEIRARYAQFVGTAENRRRVEPPGRRSKPPGAGAT